MASVAGTSVGAAPRRKRGPVLHFIGRLLHEKPLGAVCAIIFILFLFCGIFADFLAPYGYNKISPLNRLKPPSWAFPFGTQISDCFTRAARNPSGVENLASPPISAKRATTTGSVSTFCMASLSLAITSGGVLAGAIRPNRVIASKSG